jgi:hypothetical protein
MKEKLFDLIKENLKNPILYVIIIVLLITVLFLFPYIDANFFYYNRVDNRIDILTKMTELDMEKIDNNQILRDEYNNIMQEISIQSKSSINQVISKDSRMSVRIIKFVSGGFILWILAFMCMAIKQVSGIGRKILGFGFFLILGMVVGLIAASLPNIITPWVNYVGFPVLVIAFIALLVTGGGKKNKSNKK